MILGSRKAKILGKSVYTSLLKLANAEIYAAFCVVCSNMALALECLPLFEMSNCTIRAWSVSIDLFC